MDDTNEMPASSRWIHQNQIYCNDDEEDTEKLSAPLHTTISHAQIHNLQRRSFGLESTASRINHSGPLLANRAEVHDPVRHNLSTLLSTNSNMHNNFNNVTESLVVSQWWTAPAPVSSSTTSSTSSGPRTVTRGRPPSSSSIFPCNVCGKFYSRKDNLRTHQRLHSGEMPYKCMECDKLFRWQSALQSHIDSPNCPGKKELEVSSPFSKSEELSASNPSSYQNATSLKEDRCVNSVAELKDQLPKQRKRDTSPPEMSSFYEGDSNRTSSGSSSYEQQPGLDVTDSSSPSPTISLVIHGRSVEIPYHESDSQSLYQRESGKAEFEQLSNTDSGTEVSKQKSPTVGETCGDDLSF